MPKKQNESDKLPRCVSVVLKNCKMRLNEKNVANFALCNSPTDKEGYLQKRGEVNKQFQRRWFLLKGNLLFYFEKRYDREPIGVIILEGCTVELADNEADAYAFQLVFHGAGTRTYIMCAQSQDEMEAWMKAIACASYDYMKMMVTELNRQLAELKAQHAQVKDGPSSEVTTQVKGVETTMLGPGHQRHNPFNTIGGTESEARSTFAQSLESQLNNISYAGLSVDEIEKLEKLNVAKAPSNKANEIKMGSVPSVFQKLHSRYGETIKALLNTMK